MLPVNMRDKNFYVELSSDDDWKNPTSPTHFHECFEIYYLIENEVQYYIEDKTFLVKPNMIAIIPPKVIHATHSLNDKIRKRMLIYIPEVFINTTLEDDPELLKKLPNTPFLIQSSDKIEFERLLFKLYGEFSKQNKNKALEKAYLTEILVLLGNLSQPTKKSELYDFNNQTTKQMLKISEYIDNHYSERITLESIGKEFHLNPSYISRSLKEKLSISFSKYLKTVRIKEVCNLLATTDLPNGVIAEKTGFESNSDLCRVFKSIMGITPLQYKALHK